MPNVAFDVPAARPASFPEQWPEILARFRSTISDSYYASEMDMEMPRGEGAVRITGITAGPIAIYHYVTPSRTVARRAWQHIRQDGSDMFVLWCILRGSLHIAQDGREVEVAPGRLGLSGAGTPFRITALPDDRGWHESIQILVPAHLFAERVRRAEDQRGRSTPMGPAARFALDVIRLMLDPDRAPPPDTIEPFAHAAVDALCAELEPSTATPIPSAADRRLQPVIDYIHQHLGEPKLTAARVAAACRMSVRYLHKLFADRDESFHRHVWEERLARGHALLVSDRSRHLMIFEVAHRVGFQSAAHFTRAYRKRFGIAPSDARRQVEDAT